MQGAGGKGRACLGKLPRASSPIRKPERPAIAGNDRTPAAAALPVLAGSMQQMLRKPIFVRRQNLNPAKLQRLGPKRITACNLP